MLTDNLSNVIPDTLIRPPKGELITGTAKLNIAARDAWKTVGNFAGFATFITSMVRTEMTGTGVRSIRKKIFNDGHVVVEQLNSYDDVNMCMTWSLLYTTFNIGNLWAAMRVRPVTESSCEVTWDIVGEPWEGGQEALPVLEEFLKGFLAMAMSNLEAMHNR